MDDFDNTFRSNKMSLKILCKFVVSFRKYGSVDIRGASELNKHTDEEVMMEGRRIMFPDKGSGFIPSGHTKLSTAQLTNLRLY